MKQIMIFNHGDHFTLRYSKNDIPAEVVDIPEDIVSTINDLEDFCETQRTVEQKMIDDANEQLSKMEEKLIETEAKLSQTEELLRTFEEFAESINADEELNRIRTFLNTEIADG